MRVPRFLRQSRSLPSSDRDYESLIVLLRRRGRRRTASESLPSSKSDYSIHSASDRRDSEAVSACCLRFRT